MKNQKQEFNKNVFLKTTYGVNSKLDIIRNGLFNIILSEKYFNVENIKKIENLIIDIDNIVVQLNSKVDTLVGNLIIKFGDQNDK